MPILPTDCARARESASVQLDCELPELERDRLNAHLRGCAACSVWAAQVGDATRRLREAPLEVPTGGVAMPRRSRRWTMNSAVAVAAAAAVVASVVAPLGLQRESVGSQGAASVSPQANAVASRLIAQHLIALNSPLAAELAPAGDSRGPVRPI